MGMEKFEETIVWITHTDHPRDKLDLQEVKLQMVWKADYPLR